MSSLVSVDIFVDLSGWVQNELTGVDRDLFFIYDHVTATFETKINLVAVSRMAMIGPTRPGSCNTPR